MNGLELHTGVVVVRIQEQFSILPTNGQNLLGGMPGRGGDLGGGVGGDSDVLRWLSVIRVDGHVSSSLLRVRPHLSNMRG